MGLFITRNNKGITEIVGVNTGWEAARGRTRSPIIKRNIEDIQRTTYKELNVAVLDGTSGCPSKSPNKDEDRKIK